MLWRIYVDVLMVIAIRTLIGEAKRNPSVTMTKQWQYKLKRLRELDEEAEQWNTGHTS